MDKVCYQVNLQTGLGGGEVYTRFFTRALLRLGWRACLLVHREARWCHGLEREGAVVIAIGGPEEIARHLPQDKCLLIFQTLVPGRLADELRERHMLACFAHMPLYGRDPAAFRHYDLVFAVSSHVIASLVDAGILHYHAEPLYGVADLARTARPGDILREAPVYDWDRRKFRDRLLSHVYPLYFSLRRPRWFSRRGGLTLGIVSRLTPIKQFPLMFEILAPVIARFPRVNLEIFGSGGYASVRDLRRSLAPIRAQVRWWGHQDDVKAVYPELDFLLTGLPEKEALGLNVIEAQACGTPVLAVRAAPFTETVVEGETGRFFADPRLDNGASFAALLEELLRDGVYPKPLEAPTHLAKFSFPEFVARVGRAMGDALKRMARP